MSDDGLGYGSACECETCTSKEVNLPGTSYRAALADAVASLKDALPSVPTTPYAWVDKTPRQAYIDGVTDAIGIVLRLSASADLDERGMW